MNENDILMESLGITSAELSTMNPDRVEKEMASGGVLPDGLYHVQLIGVERKSSAKGTSGWGMEYEVLGGPFRGAKIEDTIWLSDKTKNRSTIFGNRMGLLVEQPPVNGQRQWRLATGISGWTDLRGWVGFIDVVTEEYEINDKVTGKPTGRKGKSNRVTFDGIYGEGNGKCEAVPRGTPAMIGVRTGSVASPQSALADGNCQGTIDRYANAGI